MLAAFLLLFTVSASVAQQPQFGQGFPRPGQPAGQNQAEIAAYSAAINQADPEAKVSAIQQFLISYPNSSLRQPAIAQMMLAKRGSSGPGASLPSPSMMNRSAAPMSMPSAAPLTAAPAPAAAPATTVSQPVGPPRDSLLQHPAQPAVVTIGAHSLTIKADNSSLSQILHQISSSTGMKIDGLGQDDRVFGDYGPGDSHEVLLSLLQGSGYNVLMVGDANGAPRQLSLSPRAAGNTAGGSSPVARNTRQEEDDSDDDVQQVPPPPEPQPSQADPNPQRSPADLQQELLRLRQQQQQQPQPQE